jgi:hypothetical protein
MQVIRNSIIKRKVFVYLQLNYKSSKNIKKDYYLF